MARGKKPATNVSCMGNQRKIPRFRFMATSKFIGLVAFFFVLIITIYSMIEMHISCDYSSLSQLIISSFGFASVYAGFYLVMAKVEHMEEERTRREIELFNLKKKNVSPEEIETQRQKISDLEQQVMNLLSQSQGPLM